MENIRKYLLLLVVKEIISMKKKLLLLLMLLSVLMYAGCGGGGEGGTPSTGTIQGTVSIQSDTSGSFNISSSNSAANFPKASLHKSQFTQQSVTNEKIVKLRPGLNDSEAAQIIAGLGGTIKKKLYGTESTYLITVND